MKAFALIVALCFACSPVRAAVSVVTGDSYFPYVSYELPENGWSNAVVKAVFAEMGQDLTIDVVPWSRGFKWTLENKYLGTYPYVYSEERFADFLYSEPINFISVKLFVSADSSIENLTDLKGKRLCLPIGYTISDTIGGLKNTYSLQVNRAADNKGCFGHVEKGWSDVGLINEHISTDRIIQIYGAKGPFRILPETYDTIPLYFIISRSYPDATQSLTQFNQALEAITVNGKLEAIRQRYLSLLADK